MSEKNNNTGNNSEVNSLRHTIYINSRDYQWNKKVIDFKEVVELFYGTMSSDPNIGYTVSYSDGYSPNNEGDMSKGQEIKVKNKMQFHVSHTGRS